jgi:hypothetical protein
VDDPNLPALLAGRVFSEKDALHQTVKSGTRISSGFATSEPINFYSHLWKHIKENDITDLVISQGLFMAPHDLLLGDTLHAKGAFDGWPGAIKNALKPVNELTKKLDGLKRLTDHYRELRERKIVFNSGFIGATSNIVIPNNAITRYLYPQEVGRNSTRMGVTDMQPIHFPDAVYSMIYDVDLGPKMDLFVTMLTPPNADGEMSLGPANGANSDAIDIILENENINLLVYMNAKYPFVRGYNHEARNTCHLDDFKKLADSGRLFIVMDDGRIPSLPANSFDNPSPAEKALAEHLVNHIEQNKAYTYGKSLQVGIGSAGVQAIKALIDSSWHGRC